jgi:hypothetical protein
VDAETCQPIPACGDGTLPRCRRVQPQCPAGQVVEVISGCWGECVDELTCERPCFDDFDCAGFCGFAEDNVSRICKDFALEGESCGGFVVPSAHMVCAPTLDCVPVEPTGDVPGVCTAP